MRPDVLLSAGLLVALFACAPTDDHMASSWLAEVDTIGDTVVVHTVAGSVWGGPGTLVEELAIGALEGPPELTFGFIQSMAVDRAGGIFVYDGQVPVIRHYDSDGMFLETIGGEGSGPGEYRNAVLGMRVRRDGRLLIVDARNARLALYDPDGTPSDHWPLASGLFTSQMLFLDEADHAYVKIVAERSQQGAMSEIGLLHFDTEGQIIDTVRVPELPGEPESSGGFFFPSKEWAWSPKGYFVVGIPSDYSFDVRRRNESVVRVRLDYEPVTLTVDQHSAYEARREWMQEMQGQNLAEPIPPTPRVKPAYQGIYVGDQGRIWVHRHVPSVLREDVQEPSRPNQPPALPFREPVVFDVFQPDGTYLGEVPVPARTALLSFDGDVVWGIRRGDFDEQYVVRLRLHAPEGG